jgi:2-oxoisovalerate dehydrogenase E1 component alpha subunit
MNFAGVHKLPTVIMVENNKYAISVPIEKQIAAENVSDRAIGYGMPGFTVDGTDPLEVYRVVKEAADRARRGDGPSLVETVCYRLTSHSSDDDHRQYRSAEELEIEKSKDPNISFAAYLKEVGVLTDEIEQDMEERIMKEVNEATDYAENAPYADPETALLHVYAEEGGNE